MPHELDKILISYDETEFQKKLFSVFFSKAGMSHFGLGPLHTENREKVEAILRDIVEKKDKAIVKYTEEFDRVVLKPEQFRIAQNDLKKLRWHPPFSPPPLLSSPCFSLAQRLQCVGQKEEFLFGRQPEKYLLPEDQ